MSCHLLAIQKYSDFPSGDIWKERKKKLLFLLCRYIEMCYAVLENCDPLWQITVLGQEELPIHYQSVKD